MYCLYCRLTLIGDNLHYMSGATPTCNTLPIEALEFCKYRTAGYVTITRLSYDPDNEARHSHRTT